MTYKLPPGRTASDERSWVTPSLQIAPTADQDSPRYWVVAGIGLAVALCAFGFIFHTEIATAIFVWNNSYAYNHCFLVLPVAVYLAWDRRQEVTATTPCPAPWIALLAIPAVAMWFVADRLGIMEARQLMALTLFQILVASLIGLGTWKVLAAPLLYLYFLVPFGEFVLPSLQVLTVHFTATGLSLLGIPNFLDGTTIQIPEGMFQVEEACSGLRFLTAMAAFSVPYVCLMYSTVLRRVVFIGLFLAAAIIGNCFRVLGTILIAHFTNNVKLIEAQHVYWGWAFYVVVGLVMAVIGVAFRQERRSPARVTPMIPPHTAGAGGSVAVLALVILLAVSARFAAGYLDDLGVTALAAAPIPLPVLPGCTAVPASVVAAASPALVGPSSSSDDSGAYRCGGDLFSLSLYRYPPRIGVRPVLLSLQAAATPFGSDDTIVQTADFAARSDPQTPVWRVTETVAPDGRYVAVATALWVNGRPSGAGLGARVAQALNAVRRAPVSPVLAVVTHFAADGARDMRGIASFLSRAEPISESVSKWVSRAKTR